MKFLCSKQLNFGTCLPVALFVCHMIKTEFKTGNDDIED